MAGVDVDAALAFYFAGGLERHGGLRVRAADGLRCSPCGASLAAAVVASAAQYRTHHADLGGGLDVACGLWPFRGIGPAGI